MIRNRARRRVLSPLIHPLAVRQAVAHPQSAHIDWRRWLCKSLWALVSLARPRLLLLRVVPLFRKKKITPPPLPSAKIFKKPNKNGVFSREKKIA